jgi:hypothetical protein
MLVREFAYGEHQIVAGENMQIARCIQRQTVPAIKTASAL